jgi:hypothetical protein
MLPDEGELDEAEPYVDALAVTPPVREALDAGVVDRTLLVVSGAEWVCVSTYVVPLADSVHSVVYVVKLDALVVTPPETEALEVDTADTPLLVVCGAECVCVSTYVVPFADSVHSVVYVVKLDTLSVDVEVV